MEASLLTTKLNVPPIRPHLVARPRLCERLQEGLSYNLILISAPAGFGKATLISQWVHGSKPPISIAWVSLDEGDNDPIRFWDYFIGAVKTAQPDFGKRSLALLHSAQPPPITSLFIVLVNELSDIPNDFLVVLDDYHNITSQFVHDGVTFSLEHLPANVHLAIATRADPPLPLARFRGKDMMLEIGADDLRFTLDEAITLLKETETPALEKEDVVALNTRTEGWAVGLKMVALSLRYQKNIKDFISSFTGSQRNIMDYLMERERSVPFGCRLAKALMRYQMKYLPEPVGTDNFWLRRDGRPILPTRIKKFISSYGKKAGLKFCYAHKLRHTSSVMYLRNGGDVFSLQKKLGHRNLVITRHYSNLADSDVRAQYLRYGVADRLKTKNKYYLCCSPIACISLH